MHDTRLVSRARNSSWLQAAEALQDGKSPEFISIELRGALDAVGEVIGKLDTEDLLGKIFSEFCIGK